MENLTVGKLAPGGGCGAVVIKVVGWTIEVIFGDVGGRLDRKLLFCDHERQLESTRAGQWPWLFEGDGRLFSLGQWRIDGLSDVLPVPTGLGKTEVALAWAWRRLVDKQPEPLHLVVCLPMRSLVTQTVQRLSSYFDALKAWNPEIDVRVHQLDEEWARWPDKPWVLVGTQDQLLSRALNRGYAMSRFEWPVYFGLLNNNCRWLIDEMQLMGPGVWTTSQLDWMRRKRFPSLKPCLTTWMSATVGTSFLRTTDRAREGLGEPSAEQAAFETKLRSALEGDEGLSWWRGAKRPVEWTKASTPAAIATKVVEEHKPGTLSLVICNTVDMTRAVFRALSVTHKVLLTSRFRREDRRQHEQSLLEFEARCLGLYYITLREIGPSAARAAGACQ